MLLNLNAILDPDRPPGTPVPPPAGACEGVHQDEQPCTDTPPAADIAADLPSDWHFEWDERAAIMEFDGNMPRAQAEALALLDIQKRMAEAARRARRP